MSLTCRGGAPLSRREGARAGNGAAEEPVWCLLALLRRPGAHAKRRGKAGLQGAQLAREDFTQRVGAPPFARADSGSGLLLGEHPLYMHQPQRELLGVGRIGRLEGVADPCEQLSAEHDCSDDRQNAQNQEDGDDEPRDEHRHHPARHVLRSEA